MNSLELQEFNKIKTAPKSVRHGFKLLKEICKLNSEFDDHSPRDIISIKRSLIAAAERSLNRLSKQDQQAALDLWRS